VPCAETIIPNFILKRGLMTLSEIRILPTEEPVSKDSHGAEGKDEQHSEGGGGGGWVSLAHSTSTSNDKLLFTPDKDDFSDREVITVITKSAESSPFSIFGSVNQRGDHGFR
jgi:hypothetical protein